MRLWLVTRVLAIAIGDETVCLFVCLFDIYLLSKTTKHRQRTKVCRPTEAILKHTSFKDTQNSILCNVAFRQISGNLPFKNRQ